MQPYQLRGFGPTKYGGSQQRVTLDVQAGLMSSGVKNQLHSICFAKLNNHTAYNLMVWMILELAKRFGRAQNSELRTQNSELRTQNSELRTQNSELYLKMIHSISKTKSAF